MVEYNSGVLFFSRKAKPGFDVRAKLFPTADASIIDYPKSETIGLMPVADQGSLALAIEQTGFQPFVLSYNWNFRPKWYRSFFGPIKIWHGYLDIPEELIEQNKEQSGKDGVVQFCLPDLDSESISQTGMVASSK